MANKNTAIGNDIWILCITNYGKQAIAYFIFLFVSCNIQLWLYFSKIFKLVKIAFHFERRGVIEFVGLFAPISANRFNPWPIGTGQ